MTPIATTGTKLLALYNIYYPARYSGVAPKGTLVSYTFNPTLVQSAKGSRLTPLYIKD